MMWFTWGGATREAAVAPSRPVFVADWIPVETPVVTRDYCPSCEPEADPLAEVLVVVYCGEHVPSARGREDDRLRTLLDATGLHYQFNEAGGADNKAVCDFIHRPTTKRGHVTND